MTKKLTLGRAIFSLYGDGSLTIGNRENEWEYPFGTWEVSALVRFLTQEPVTLESLDARVRALEAK